MKLPRIRRILAALMTIFSLLFTQFAVAAYACPDLAMTAMVVKAAQDAMPGCADMDMAQPGLCQAHCDSGHQTLDTPTNPPVAAFVPGCLVAVLPALDVQARLAPVQANPVLLTRTTAPPLAIRHCCFRI